jgi:hypothetical protein
MSVYVYPFGDPSSRRYAVRVAAFEEIERLRGASDAGQARTIVRFIYYRLVASRVIEKDSSRSSGRQPSQYVSEALTWLRERGYVDWSEIVDETRTVLDHTGWSAVRDALVAQARYARLDPWYGDPPVLVVESKSLAAFFGSVAYTYRVPLIPLGGQSSGSFLANDVAQHLRKTTPVLYVGDYDKAGGDIERSAQDRLLRFAPAWAGEWQRLAVTDEQHARYADLVIVKPDHRSKPPTFYETLEAEAIEQTELTRIVEDALDNLLPVALDEIEQREAQERADALRRIARWRT